MDRRGGFVLLLATLVVALLVLRKTSREETIACANYDSQVWAQSVYDTDSARYAALDPDDNRLACEALPHGAAPARWANEVSPGAESATLVSVSDGDTIRVDVGGREETVRLILIDTPETRDPNNPPECYGAEATAVLEGFLPRGSALYLETDVSERDRFGRLLRYVWLDRGEGSIWSTRPWSAPGMPLNRRFHMTSSTRSGSRQPLGSPASMATACGPPARLMPTGTPTSSEDLRPSRHRTSGPH